ncbi:Mitotic spindle assembly checkpoint protein MAD2A [Galdieria sulphuraria]|nr:Mitotic spindle assembly checkpoint protein MAD2A [Galdieria sulphuraria]
MSYSESQPSVTLRGSTEVVSDFFVYSVNSILYQRGIYPAEQFSRVNNFGTTKRVDFTIQSTEFNIEITNNKDNYNSDEQQIVSQIQAVIRQITASVTFLPLLDEPCTFDMLIYTDVDVQIPETWEESDPKIIINQKEVKLRSFTTKVHKVETMVSYATDIH